MACLLTLLYMLQLVLLMIAHITAFASTRYKTSVQHPCHSPNSIQKACPITGMIDNGLVDLYHKTYNVKCPFLRRKSFDALEITSRMVRVGTKYSTPLFLEHIPRSLEAKLQNPQITEVADCITNDWLNKGYYITGNMTSTIYKDNCMFDGPDPDMPVQGLRKFALTVAQLFIHSESHSELVRPLDIDQNKHTITAYWRISGKLNLPWQPRVKPWTGSTVYSIDTHTGLIEKHVEQWDITVLEAFAQALFPWIVYLTRS